MDTMTATRTIRQFANHYGITISNEWIDERPDGNDAWMPGSSHWKVTLRRNGHRMTIYFSQGPAIEREPSVYDILECIQSDCSYDGGFEEWASDCGYDTDSRKAERIFKACQRERAKMIQFLGADLFAEFAEVTA